jgi:hypothetical protein
MISYHRWFPRSLLGVSLAAALWLANGCASVDSVQKLTKRDPIFVPKNFTGVPRLPATLRRVVLLPVAGAAGVSVDALASFDAVMAAELQRTARFEVVTADPAALLGLCDRPRLLSVDALPPGFLSLLAREYDAEAVMFVDVTALSPYQPLSVGLRAKLAGADGTILWAFDTLFTTSDPAVANAARRHDRARHPTADPGDLSYTVLRSPARLADYAATTAFATLPPR